MLKLTKRIGNAKLPNVYLVDMESEMKKRNTIFSEVLQEKIKDRLERHEQIILLLNRRGFSTFILVVTAAIHISVLIVILP